ncbi:hypothetical protein MYP_3205 [Sporocytophaga myxococcoides]|uniref:Uncharacterized protein n=1 Tax=Sporocytophaga myxococcoides TaxID=153721 RepID=A0A098LG74_9BACT|nr:hypothetical protein MYP_3205 [Sporocytophaga myxococcoides]
MILFFIQFTTVVCHALSEVFVCTTMRRQLDLVLFLSAPILAFTSLTYHARGTFIPFIIKLFPQASIRLPLTLLVVNPWAIESIGTKIRKKVFSSFFISLFMFD